MIPTPDMDGARYRKKPVVVEAVQITDELIAAHLLDGHELPFGLSLSASSYNPTHRSVYSWTLRIDTLEGRMKVDPNDWVIRGVIGELYPCKPDIFELTYEKD